MHGPTIIPAVDEWPGSFEVKYFDKKAYLTQGLQPYVNAFVAHLKDRTHFNLDFFRYPIKNFMTGGY